MAKQDPDIITSTSDPGVLEASTGERYEAVFNCAALGIILVGLDGQIEEANPAAMRILGYGPEEFEPASFSEFMYAEDKTDNWILFRELVEGRRSQTQVEKRFIRRDGSAVWIGVTGSLVREASGEPHCVVATLEDVTQRRQAEKLLEEQQAYLSALHDTTLALVNRLSIPDVLEAILKRAGTLLGASHGYIFLVDETRDRLVAKVTMGIGVDYVEAWMKQGQGLAGKVWQTGQTMVVSDYDAWSGRSPTFARGAIQAAVCVPLKSVGEVVGVIGLMRTERDASFKGSEVSLLDRFAQLASIALDNARLFTATQHALHERTEAEAALRQQTEELRQQASLLNLAHDAIVFRKLGTGTILFWNDGAARMYGWSADEALGQVSQDLLGTEFPEQSEAVEAIVPTSERGERELVQRDRDGNRLVVLSRWVLQRDERGEPLAILEINRDITRRKRAEERLLSTLAQLKQQYEEVEYQRATSQAVLDATSEAMVLIDQDRRFLAVNGRFGEMFDIDSRRVIGHRWVEFRTEVERVFAAPQTFFRLVAGNASDTETRFMEIVRQVWPVPRELELFSVPVNMKNGEYLGRLYAFRDVTREREADRLKSEFVSLVSHELRTPLTSIKGYVELMRDYGGDTLSGRQRDFLAIVTRNTDRLAALIDDVLDVSHIDAGRIELHPEPTDVSLLVRGVADSFRPQFAAKRQQVRLVLPGDLPVVWADPDRVVQILTNLLSNSQKYTPDGGRIGVSARRDAGEVRIDVRDNGIGLSPAERSHLFTRFYRAKNPASQGVGGTGLGLAISRSLVEMHGGQISVTSAPGKGSIFSFTLPITAQPIAQPEPAAADSSRSP